MKSTNDINIEKINTNKMNTSTPPPTPFIRPHIIVISAIICTLLWGSAFPGVKIGYKLFGITSGDIPSYILFAGIRFLIAGIITLALCNFLKLDNSIKDIKAIRSTYMNKDFILKGCILAFLLTFFQYICFYIGLAYASSVNGSIINASSTIFTVILSFIFFKNDKVSIFKILGIILSFSGIVIVTLKDYLSIDFLASLFSSGNGEASSSVAHVLSLDFNLKGEGLLLIAALSFAIGTVFSKKFAYKYNPATLTGFQLTVGGLCLTIMGFILGGKLHATSFKPILLLAYLSILSAVAFTLWTILLKYNKASKIAIFNSLTPVFGVILSGIFLHENILSVPILLALALACSGIVMMNIEK